MILCERQLLGLRHFAAARRIRLASFGSMNPPPTAYSSIIESARSRREGAVQPVTRFCDARSLNEVGALCSGRGPARNWIDLLRRSSCKHVLTCGSGLARQRSGDDTVAVDAHQKRCVLIHHIGGEMHYRYRNRMQIGIELVGLGAVAAKGEIAVQRNIEELFTCPKFVDIDGATKASRGRQVELAHKVFLVAAHASPTHGIASRKRSNRNRSCGLRHEYAVTYDGRVGFLKDRMRLRNEVEDKREASHIRVGPADRAATKLVGIDSIKVPLTRPFGSDAMEPVLFSSRTMFEIFPAPSAVNRPAVEIGPLELQPPIRKEKLPVSEAVVKAVFC